MIILRADDLLELWLRELDLADHRRVFVEQSKRAGGRAIAGERLWRNDVQELPKSAIPRPYWPRGLNNLKHGPIKLKRAG